MLARLRIATAGENARLAVAKRLRVKCLPAVAMRRRVKMEVSRCKINPKCPFRAFRDNN